MKTPATPEQIAVAKEILEIAMTCKEHDIFVEFVPHVGWVYLKVYLGGWTQNHGAPEYQHHFHLDNPNAMKSATTDLKNFLQNVPAMKEELAQKKKLRELKSLRELADKHGVTLVEQE